MSSDLNDKSWYHGQQIEHTSNDNVSKNHDIFCSYELRSTKSSITNVIIILNRIYTNSDLAPSNLRIACRFFYQCVIG